MNRFVTLSTLITLASCQTTRYPPDRVDPVLLQHIDDSARDDIADARRARDEAIDAVAAARNNLEQARRELEIARDGKVVADAKLTKAKTELRVRRHAAGIEFDGNGNGNGNGGSAVDAEVRSARTEVEAAKDRICWRNEVIGAAECDFELAKARLDLAEAKVNLEEARAVRETERPEAAELDMVAIEREVRGKQTEVDVCQVRCDAAVKEVELAKQRLDETPEQRAKRMKLERRTERTDGS